MTYIETKYDPELERKLIDAKFSPVKMKFGNMHVYLKPSRYQELVKFLNEFWESSKGTNL